MPRRNRFEDPVNFLGYTTHVVLTASQAVSEDIGRQTDMVKRGIAFNVTNENGALAKSLKAMYGVAGFFIVPTSVMALGIGYENRPRLLSEQDLGDIKVILAVRGVLSLMAPVVTAAILLDKQEVLKPVALSAIPLALTMLDALATSFVVKGINS